MTAIKTFRVDAEWIDSMGQFNFEEVQAEVCKRFDTWRKKLKPRILSVNFSKVDEDILKAPHYLHFWSIKVLYYKD